MNFLFCFSFNVLGYFHWNISIGPNLPDCYRLVLLCTFSVHQILNTSWWQAMPNPFLVVCKRFLPTLWLFWSAMQNHLWPLNFLSSEFFSIGVQIWCWMIPLLIEQHTPKIFSSRCISELNDFKTELSQSCKFCKWQNKKCLSAANAEF